MASAPVTCQQAEPGALGSETDSAQEVSGAGPGPAKASSVARSACPAADTDAKPVVDATDAPPETDCEEASKHRLERRRPRGSVDVASTAERMLAHGLLVPDIARLLDLDEKDVRAELPKRARNESPSDAHGSVQSEAVTSNTEIHATSQLPLESDSSACASASSLPSASLQPTPRAGLRPDEASRALCELQDPPELTCPILHALMEDPVVAEDGYTYEREAIESALQHRQRSPTTNADMGNHVVPNRVVKTQIAAHKENVITKILSLAPSLNASESVPALRRAEDLIRPSLPAAAARLQLADVLCLRMQLPASHPYREGALEEFFALHVEGGEAVRALQMFNSLDGGGELLSLDEHMVERLFLSSDLQAHLAGMTPSPVQSLAKWLSKRAHRTPFCIGTGWRLFWLCQRLHNAKGCQASLECQVPSERNPDTLRCDAACHTDLDSNCPADGSASSGTSSSGDAVATALIATMTAEIADANGVLPGVHRQRSHSQPRGHAEHAQMCAEVSTEILERGVAVCEDLIKKTNECDGDSVRFRFQTFAEMLAELASRQIAKSGMIEACELLAKARLADPTNLAAHKHLLALRRQELESAEKVDVKLLGSLLVLLHEDGEKVPTDWLTRLPIEGRLPFDMWLMDGLSKPVLADFGMQLADAGFLKEGANALLVAAEAQEAGGDWATAAKNFAAAYRMDSNNESALQGMVGNSAATARQCASLQKRCDALEEKLQKSQQSQQESHKAMLEQLQKCQKMLVSLTHDNRLLGAQSVFSMEWDVSSVDTGSVPRPHSVNSMEIMPFTDVSLYLSFFPNGNDEADLGHCSLFVAVHGHGNPMFEMDCTLVINGIERRFTKPAEHPKFGYSSFCEVPPVYQKVGIKIHSVRLRHFGIHPGFQHWVLGPRDAQWQQLAPGVGMLPPLRGAAFPAVPPEEL